MANRSNARHKTPVNALYRALLRHRLAATLLLLLTTFVFGSALVPPSKLLVDFSLESLLVPDDAARDELMRLHDDFGDDLDMVAILVRVPEGHTVAETPVLDTIASIATHLRARPEIDAARVVTLHDLPLLRSSSGVVPHALSSSKDPLKTVRELATHSSFRNLLLADDLSATLIVAPFSTLAPDRRHAMLDDLQQTLDNAIAKLPSGSALMPVGVPLVQASYTRTVLRDILLLVPLTLLIIALLLGFAYRRVYAIVGPLTGVGLATIWTLGLIQHLGLPFDMVNSVTGVVILIVGVASGAHIVSRHREEVAALGHTRPDSPRTEAIIETMRHMTPACFVTSATTAVGFGALASADLPAIASFGLVLAAGVMLAWLAQMIWMPVFLSFVRPDRVLPKGRDLFGSRTHHLLERFVDKVLAHPVKVLVGAGVLAVIALVFSLRLHADARMSGELASDHPVARALAAMEEDLAGVLVHSVVIRGRPGAVCLSDIECGDGARCRKVDLRFAAVSRLKRAQSALTGQAPDPRLDTLEERLHPQSASLFGEDEPLTGACTPTVLDTPTLAFIGDLERWLEQRDTGGLVSHVNTILDLARDLGPLPQLSAELLAERVSVLEGGAQELVGRLLSPDHTRTQLVIRANDIGLAAWRAFEPQLRAEVDRLVDYHDIRNYDVAVTGGSTMAERAISGLADDLMGSLGWTVLLVLAFIVWLVKSVRLGLLALIPNQLPILYTFGVMGAFDMPIRASTLIVFSVAFGIAVDDTTHLFHRYREEVMRQGEGRAAIIKSFIASGQPIVLTALILVCGFMTNALSDFMAMVEFGLLSAMTLLIAVIADLTVTPALLMVTRGRLGRAWAMPKS